jgi:hypothetical protein
MGQVFGVCGVTNDVAKAVSIDPPKYPLDKPQPHTCEDGNKQQSDSSVSHKELMDASQTHNQGTPNTQLGVDVHSVHGEAYTSPPEKFDSAIENCLNQVTQVTNTLWTSGQAQFEEKCKKYTYHCAFTWLAGVINGVETQIKSVEQSLLSQTKNARAKSALQHLKGLSGKIAVIKTATGPHPLPVEAREARFLVRQMPADNSCLFHCIAHIFHKEDANDVSPMTLRQNVSNSKRKV